MSSIMNRVNLKAYHIVIITTVIFTLLRLITAAGMGLSGDEAHYALYGYFLDLSYFDHPPLVGWLQAFVENFSSSNLAMRFWPILFSAITGWQLFVFANELFPNKDKITGLVAFVLFQMGIVFQFLALGLVPDTILMLLALLVFRVLWRVLQNNNKGAWLLLGVLFGLAGLAKYTAVILVISPVLLILIEKRYDLLKDSGLWWAVLIAFVMITPVIYWNLQHDWISIAYQFHHGTGTGSWNLLTFVKSQLGQFVAYTPLIYIAGLAATISAWRQRSSLVARYTLYTAMPLMFIFAWNGGYAITLFHWTSAAWLLLLPWLANWLISNWPKVIQIRILTYFSLLFSIVFITWFYSELIFPWTKFPPAKDSLAGEFYGWQGAAEKARVLQKQIDAKSGQGEAQIFIGSWTLASRIAWYIRPQPVMVTDNRFDQFDIWYGAPKEGASGIFIDWSLFPYPPMVSSQPGGFQQCNPVGEYNVEKNERLLTRFTYYYCQGYHPYEDN